MPGAKIGYPWNPVNEDPTEDITFRSSNTGRVALFFPPQVTNASFLVMSAVSRIIRLLKESTDTVC